VLTDNWYYTYGGVDEYVRWAGATGHESFFTNEAVKSLYEQYVADLIARVNVYTGVAYRDDPTIMAWELINEARCGGEVMPQAGPCTPTTIRDWAAEMAAYVKSLDPNHMVALGDEGFCSSTSCPDLVAAVGSNWTNDGGTGDFGLYTAVPDIDYGTFKWQPGYWSVPTSQFSAWATEHGAVAAALGKPAVLSQFMSSDRATRATLYGSWCSTIESANLAGSFVWATNADPYPDYDGLSINYPGNAQDLAVRNVLLDHSADMAAK
jgi:mannan endo-1,4-beta-mannosidase